MVIESADDRPSLVSAAEVVAAELPAAQRYLDIADVMIVAIGVDEIVTLANRKAAEVIGCPAAEIMGQNWFDAFIPNPDRERARGIFRRLIRGEVASAARFENSILCRGGRSREIAWRNTVLHDPAGTIVGTLSSGEDITLRRAAERRLEESNQHLRLAVRAARLGTWAWDIRTGSFAVDRGWAEMLGHDPKDLEPHISTWEGLIHPHDKQRVTQALDDCLHERSRLFQVECRMRSRHGEWRWVRVIGSISKRDARGKPAQMSGVQADAHERIETERALHESEALLSRAQQIAHVGSWDWDLGQDQMAWSAELSRVLGLEAGMMPSKDVLLDRVHPADRARLQELLDAARDASDGAFALEHRIVQPGGVERIVHHVGETVSDVDGRPERVIGTLQDITERKQVEAEVHALNEELEQRVRERTAQLEAANRELEAFAYTVSHDLRAPLRSMDGFSQALLEDYEAKLDDAGRDYLQRIRAASARMSTLIDDILRLSRISRAELCREPVDLSQMAHQIVGELRASDTHREIEVVVQPGLVAESDPQLVRAALQNLLSNAFKYTARTEHPRVEVGALSGHDTPAFFVRDNGAGFDPQYAEQVFRPFQRLHSDAEFPGSGVGLATVQRIIHRHGGRIWAEAEVGRGATFHFTL